MQNVCKYVRFEVFMAVKTQVIFWVLTMRSVVDTRVSQDHAVSIFKHWYPTITLNSITTQKTMT